MESVTYYARFGYCDDFGLFDDTNPLRVCVSFPDVPGANTAGCTKEHAVEMAKEVLKLCLEDCNEKIKAPSSLEVLRTKLGDTLEECENSFEFVPITVEVTITPL